MDPQSIHKDNRGGSKQSSATVILRHRTECSQNEGQSTVVQQSADGSDGREIHMIDSGFVEDSRRAIGTTVIESFVRSMLQETASETSIDGILALSIYEMTPSDLQHEREMVEILKMLSDCTQARGSLRHIVSRLLSLHPSSLTAAAHSLPDLDLGNKLSAIQLLFMVRNAKHTRPSEAMVSLMRDRIARMEVSIQRSVVKIWNDLQNHARTRLEGSWARTMIGSRSIVVVKKGRKNNYKVAHHWIKKITAQAKLSTLNQEQIVRFLTAFPRGNQEDDTNHLEYHMAFEWAEGDNLEDLWAYFPHRDRTAAFVRWVMKQLYGLSRALNADQYVLDEEGIYRGPSYRHGDLKPENILWFPREGTGWGTLKIGDWGLARSYPLHEMTVLRHATTTQLGKRRYEPPETIFRESNLSELAKHARSRLSDVWSMGCVIMECIVWLVYGLKEQKRFKESSRGHHGLSEYFFEPRKEGNVVNVVVHGAVKRWLKHMKNDPVCRPGETAVGDALDIVYNSLLVVRLPRGDLSQDQASGFPCANLLEAKQPLPPSSPSSTLALTQGTGASRVNISMPSEIAASPPSPTGFSDASEFSAADDVYKPIRRKYLQEEPENCRATDLHHLLRKLVETNHHDDYWLPCGSPAPVPQEFSECHQSPARLSDSIDSKAGTAVMKQYRPGNYAHPDLYRERWMREVDNDLTARTVFKHQDFHTLTTNAQSTPTLCGKCADLHKILWSPSFLESFAAEKLRQNAESKACDLCCLFWQACIRNKVTVWQTIFFQRIDSHLEICGTISPAVSLFRNSAMSNANFLQIGLEQLPEPAHSVYFDKMRAWIADCDKNHVEPVCKAHMSDSTLRLPTRLIDVGTGDDGCVTLKLTRGDENLQWIALSYRWGGRTHFSTTRGNIDEHIRGMNPADLPDVFQDAIRVTRGLGHRFLWIDAICIIQGEDGDFATESKRMEDVYSGADCVLAASYTNSFRLFDTREGRACVALGSDRSQTSTVYACEMIEDFKAHVLDAPLSRRGWVLQEHALARRTIFFTEYQTYWECGHGIRCKTMAKMHNASSTLLRNPDFPGTLKSAVYGEKVLRFQELYRQYSRLELTSAYDRPAAIDGLQRRLLRAMNVAGGFGTLEDHKNPGLLCRSLMWHRASEALKVIEFPEGREKVPSWSWMSVSGAIDYVRLGGLDYAWQDVQSPWSRAKDGHVDKAIVAEARLLNTVEVGEAHGMDVRLDIPADFNQEELLAAVLGVEKGDEDMDDRRHCVLILEKTSILDDSGRKQCRRVGAGVVVGKYLSVAREICSIL